MIRKPPKGSEEARLLYFEIQKELEMAAILGFLEPDEEGKIKGMTVFFERVEEKLAQLKKIRT